MITVAPGALATPGVCGFGPGFNRGFFGLRFGFDRGLVGPRFGFLGLASLSGRASSRRHRRRGRRGARGLSGHTCRVRNRDALSEQPPLVAPDNADIYIVPALIANAADAAGLRYVEFLTATSTTRTRAGPTPGRAAGSSPGASGAGSRSVPFGHSTWPPG